MSGRGPRLISLPTRVGALPVGSAIKLNVNGAPWEFLIVHQGLPSDLYDVSCNGTWVLMKDIYEKRVWNSTRSNVYETSAINTWLNGDFLGLLDSNIQSAIKQVKIPYRSGGGSGGTDQSGANGLSCKVFLLSGYEVGWTQSTNSGYPVDGACLSYFSGMKKTDEFRIAYLNGEEEQWWLRSPITSSFASVVRVYNGGANGSTAADASLGIRPAFIFPSGFIATSDMLA